MNIQANLNTLQCVLTVKEGYRINFIGKNSKR